MDSPCIKVEMPGVTDSRDRRGFQMFKKGHVIQPIYLIRLILAMIHIYTKFELSSFSHSVDTRGPKFSTR